MFSLPLWFWQPLATHRPCFLSTLHHSNSQWTPWWTHTICLFHSFKSWYFLSLKRQVKGGCGSLQVIVDTGENHPTIVCKLRCWVAGMVTVQKVTVCPRWGHFSAFVYKRVTQRGFNDGATAQHLQRKTLQSSFPTIHFQLKETQTLLAGPSIVAKVLIVRFYPTAGLQGFDSPL